MLGFIYSNKKRKRREENLFWIGSKFGGRVGNEGGVIRGVGKRRREERKYIRVVYWFKEKYILYLDEGRL